MSRNKLYLNWEDINDLLDSIYNQSKDEIDYVTGIPRGGTILAILYSHRFNIQYMERISNHYPRLLVLDDIADTGKTLTDFTDNFTNPKFGTLHYKESSTFTPNYYAKIVGTEWIVYPWEQKDSKTIQDYLND